MKRQALLGILFSVLFLLSLVPAHAQFGNRGEGGPFDLILDVFNLNFLRDTGGDISQDAAIAFIRLVIWIVVFAIFQAVLQRVGSKGGAIFTGKTSGVIAFAIATISAAFIPEALLAGIAAAYGAVLGFALVLFLAVGVFWIGIVANPFKGSGHNLLEHGFAVVVLGFLLVLLDTLRDVLSGNPPSIANIFNGIFALVFIYHPDLFNKIFRKVMQRGG